MRVNTTDHFGRAFYSNNLGGKLAIVYVGIYFTALLVIAGIWSFITEGFNRYTFEMIGRSFTEVYAILWHMLTVPQDESKFAE